MLGKGTNGVNNEISEFINEDKRWDENKLRREDNIGRFMVRF